MPDESVRRRLTWTLFAAVALATTGYIAAITISSLAARSMTGSPTLAGIPSAAAVLGVAAGTSALGQMVTRWGRRGGLVTGYAIATLGSSMAATAVVLDAFPLLVASMTVTGFGQASSQYARYTAADMVPSERRGSAVSLIVWAGTFGAVLGPRLLEPSGAVAERLTGRVYAGGYLTALVFMLLATMLLTVALRPDPALLAHPGEEEPTTTGMLRARDALRIPAVQIALASMMVGQLVMVLIMTATPIHIEDSGFGLDLVGVIISAHTLGMFALSPVTGRLVDRIGSYPVIAAGAVMLVASGVMSAAAPRDGTTLLGWALFLLGLGWNFGFVGGSAVLSRATPKSIRPVVVGRVDSAVWLTSGLASSSSGLLLAGPGYTVLSVLGAAIGLVPLLALVLRARAALQPA